MQSFSTLRRLKTWFRLNMGKERFAQYSQEYTHKF
jgi:hypothetical protein